MSDMVSMCVRLRDGRRVKWWVYLDELSCVCDGGFLCDLLLDGLGLAGARRGR